jgi:hypothetical protein
VEVENVVTLAFACEDADGLIRKIALLEGELAKAHCNTPSVTVAAIVHLQ